jgi:type VI protein secretion system component VasF
MAAISRKLRKTLQKQDQRRSRIENGAKKNKERVRKEVRLKAALANGMLPYTPTIMSWLSAALDTPSKQIVQADIDTFLKA